MRQWRRLLLGLLAVCLHACGYNVWLKRSGGSRRAPRQLGIDEPASGSPCCSCFSVAPVFLLHLATRGARVWAAEGTVLTSIPSLEASSRCVPALQLQSQGAARGLLRAARRLRQRLLLFWRGGGPAGCPRAGGHRVSRRCRGRGRVPLHKAESTRLKATAAACRVRFRLGRLLLFAVSCSSLALLFSSLAVAVRSFPLPCTVSLAREFWCSAPALLSGSVGHGVGEGRGAQGE